MGRPASLAWHRLSARCAGSQEPLLGQLHSFLVRCACDLDSLLAHVVGFAALSFNFSLHYANRWPESTHQNLQLPFLSSVKFRHCCNRSHLQAQLQQLKEFDKNGTPVDGRVCNLRGNCSSGRNGTHQGLSSYPSTPGSEQFASGTSFLLDMLRGGIEMHELRSISTSLTRMEHELTGSYPKWSPSRRTVACLITGKIRGHDRGEFDEKTVAQMKAVTAGTDLFVCSDQEDRIDANFRNFTNLVAYKTAEDDGGYQADLRNITVPMRYHEPGTPPGLKSIQWWRLQQCWKLVQQYEEQHDFRYSFYMKTRSDCEMRGGCYPCLDTYQVAWRISGPAKSHSKKLLVQFCRIKLSQAS